MNNIHYFRLSLFWLIIEFPFSGIFIDNFYNGEMILSFLLSNSYTGEGNGNPLQYSCLESPMDRGAWWATVGGVTKSQTQLSN